MLIFVLFALIIYKYSFDVEFLMHYYLNKKKVACFRQFMLYSFISLSPFLEL